MQLESPKEPTLKNLQKMRKLFKKMKKKKILPPQQKPAAPIADTPLLLRASMTGFVSSKPLSYKKSNRIGFQELLVYHNCLIKKL